MVKVWNWQVKEDRLTACIQSGLKKGVLYCFTSSSDQTTFLCVSLALIIAQKASGSAPIIFSYSPPPASADLSFQ